MFLGLKVQLPCLEILDVLNRAIRIIPRFESLANGIARFETYPKTLNK